MVDTKELQINNNTKTGCKPDRIEQKIYTVLNAMYALVYSRTDMFSAIYKNCQS